jgi:hypothetical protein
MTALALAALTALAPATASASILTKVQHVYQTHGQIPPCEFTSPQLEGALKAIDTYGAQYFADFTTAVQNALSARVLGVCSPKPASTPAVVAPSTPSRPLRLGPITAATGADLPAPIVLMAVLAALFALTGLLTGLVWWRGWSPAWVGAWRHMWSDTGHRARGTWQEFSDWLRSGRPGRGSG